MIKPTQLISVDAKTTRGESECNVLMQDLTPALSKLTHLIYGVVKSGKPFDANFATRGLAIQDGI